MKLALTVLLAIYGSFALAADKAPVAQPNAAPQAVKAAEAKKISTTLGELYVAYPALMKLFNAELPVKNAVALRKTVVAIEAEKKLYEDQWKDLIKKHSGGKNQVPNDKMEAFLSDMKTLREIKVELDGERVPLKLLGDSIKLSALDMVKLEPFVVQ